MPKCSAEEGPDVKRQRVEAIECHSEDESFESVASNEEVDARYFKPITLIADWSEPGTTTRRITLAVLLPTGVGKGDFS